MACHDVIGDVKLDHLCRGEIGVICHDLRSGWKNLGFARGGSVQLAANQLIPTKAALHNASDDAVTRFFGIADLGLGDLDDGGRLGDGGLMVLAFNGGIGGMGKEGEKTVKFFHWNTLYGLGCSVAPRQNGASREIRPASLAFAPHSQGRQHLPRQDGGAGGIAGDHAAGA
jgi:hypothetical protein